MYISKKDMNKLVATLGTFEFQDKKVDVVNLPDGGTLFKADGHYSESVKEAIKLAKKDDKHNLLANKAIVGVVKVSKSVAKVTVKASAVTVKGTAKGLGWAGQKLSNLADKINKA